MKKHLFPDLPPGQSGPDSDKFRHLSHQDLEEQENTIRILLQSTCRKGIEGIFEFLDKTHFFTIKSSENRHHNWRGGLAQHSLGVYMQMSAMNRNLPEPYPEDTIILVSILHDLCKAYNRRPSYSGISLVPDVYSHLNRPSVSSNHGSLSAALTRYQCGLELTDEEYNAIKGHMHRSDPGSLQQLVHEADKADR